MRCALAVLVVALVAGCSTVEKSQNVITEIVRVPAAELTGLSRAELEARLHLKPANRLSVIEAWLEGEEVVARVGYLTLVSGTQCRGGRRPSMMLQQGGIALAPPEFVFRGERVAAVRHRQTQNDGVPGAQEVVVTCSELHLTASDTAKSAVTIAFAAPLLFPFGAAIAVTNSATAKDLNTPLSKLALGREPLGGLDAYLANLPEGVMLKTRDGANAQVDFRYYPRPENQASFPDIRVQIVDGRVARLSSSQSCVLAKDRTFSCERTYP